MEVILSNISKRYGYQWVIRNCNYRFPTNSISGIAGHNGSGKSTLIKIISSYLSPTAGKIAYKSGTQVLSESSVYNYISFVGPYTSLIKEYTLEELFDFHFIFKGRREQIEYAAFYDLLELKLNKGKRMGELSSGMNQRVQLALALYSDTPLLLLDEPTSYLDVDAKKWFYGHLRKCSDNRTVIISSNDEEDFNLCGTINDLSELNPQSTSGT